MDTASLKANLIKTDLISLKLEKDPTIWQTSSNREISFYDDLDLVGVLYLESPMRFEGRAKESAKIFFNEVMKLAGK